MLFETLEERLLAMGTPNSDNKIATLFGKTPVNVGEMTPAERWEALSEALGNIAPIMKYLNGFRELRLDKVARFIPVTGESSRMLRERCLHLTDLETTYEGPQDAETCRYRMLFLQINGRILLVTADLKKCWYEDRGSPGGKALRWDGIGLAVTGLESEPRHLEIFTPKALADTFQSLLTALTETEEDRAKRLRVIRKHVGKMTWVMERLEHPFDDKDPYR